MYPEYRIQPGNQPASFSCAFLGETLFHLGPNDGGIKRGDRADTGDEEAALDELGSGAPQTTVDPDAPDIESGREEEPGETESP